jgi:hypothetical protein
MRLYERLICTLPKKDDGIRDAMIRAVPVLCDNVASYYYTESPQEYWDVRKDFPNSAPPWPLAFYEWRRPRFSNSDGKMVDLGCRADCGLLVEAELVPSVITPDKSDTERVLAYALTAYARDQGITTAQLHSAFGLRGSPDDVVSGLREMFGQPWIDAATNKILLKLNSQSNRPKWVLRCAYAAAVDGGACRFVIGFSIPLMADGSHLLPQSDKTAIGMWPMVAIENESTESIDRRRQVIEASGMSSLHVPLLAISLAHCKNVNLSDGPPIAPKPREMRRHPGFKGTRYKILEIEPMRKIIMDEGDESNNGTVKALHICRGHFKDYRERGLFGKVKGTFWWEQSMRGSASVGRIEKTYSVRSPIQSNG